jgi:predicted HicB family RNase H-like nuclease
MCNSNGKTLEEATKNNQEALQFHIESCLEDNLPIEIIDEERATGRIAIRTSKATHLKLLHIAEEQDVSVSHLINDAIVKQYG